MTTVATGRFHRRVFHPLDLQLASLHSELNPHGLLPCCVRFAPVSHPTRGNTRYWSARYGFDQTGLAPAGLL
jgi:hypothetical protein